MKTVYLILSEYEVGKLESLVDRYLRERWVCQGGVSAVITSGGEMRFYQAMTKEVVIT